MPVAKTQLRQILKRDNQRCGLHMGGCGRYLSQRSMATVDHMIPQSFINFMPAVWRRDFRSNWNTQPMCHTCNNVLKGGQVNDWPLFECQCHFLQVAADGGMYVHERTGSRETKHLLLDGAVGDGTRVRLFSSRLPGDGNSVGYSRSPASRGGHLLVPVPENSVAVFNWFELARIGEARGAWATDSDDGKKCIFLPNGEIVSSSQISCAKRFRVEFGHRNLRFDPFAVPDK